MEGIWTVIPTVFNNQIENIMDLNSMSQLIERQIKVDVTGIVLLGTTSEVSTLSKDEQIAQVKQLTEKYWNQVYIMIGVSGNNTAEINEMINQIKHDCDYIMLTVPYYNKPNQEGLEEHFKYLANNNSDVKFVLYNVPVRTGVNLEIDTLVNILKDCPNIIGIKEASGNISQIQDTVDRTHISVMCGDDNLFIPAMSVGCKGLISVASNIVPSTLVSIYNQLIKEEYVNARISYSTIHNICKTCFITSNPIPLKMILYKMSLITSDYVRLPLKVPTNIKIVESIDKTVDYIMKNF